MEDSVVKKCPLCNGEIKDEGNVQVCPACGVVHHKACWEANNGCSTEGCSQQHKEEKCCDCADVQTQEEIAAPCAVNTVMPDNVQNPSPVGAAVQYEVQRAVCRNCGTELQPGREFCPVCGTNCAVAVPVIPNGMNPVGMPVVNNVAPKKKKTPIIIAIVLAVVILIGSIGGVVLYKVSENKKAEEEAARMAKLAEEYRESAEEFYDAVLTSGANMEKTGNSIYAAWKKYVTTSGYGTYYNGTYIYSANTAVEAGQKEQASAISSVKAADSKIKSMYEELKDVPKTRDKDLEKIKEAIDDLYDAYKAFYSCTMDPEGNYTSWSSEYSSTHSDMVDAVEALKALLD